VQSGDDEAIYWPNTDRVVVVAANGTLDTSFNAGRQVGVGGNESSLPLADGSLILGYSRSRRSARPSTWLQKLEPDGSTSPSAPNFDLGVFAGDPDWRAVPAGDHGLFSDLFGTSVFNPDGKRDVFADADVERFFV